MFVCGWVMVVLELLRTLPLAVWSSAQVVLQLKALSVSATVAASFDREKWRAQLEPIIDMWAKLTSAGADTACAPCQLSLL